MIDDQITARLYVFIRENIKGGCKKFSIGDKCECALCDLDRLLDASNQNTAMNHSELIASLRAESDELIKYQFSHTKEAMSCLQRLHDLSLEAADALQALERVPMTEEVALKIAHRRATTYTHRSDPHYSGYAFVPYTLMDFVRDLEAHHGITPPESKG